MSVNTGTVSLSPVLSLSVTHWVCNEPFYLISFPRVTHTWRISLAAHCSYLEISVAVADSGHRSFRRKVMPPRYFTCKKIERDHVKTFYLHIVSKVCTWANSDIVRRGKARRATGITAFIMSFLHRIKIVVSLMTRFRLATTRQRVPSQPALTSQRQEPVMDPLWRESGEWMQIERWFVFGGVIVALMYKLSAFVPPV